MHDDKEETDIGNLTVRVYYIKSGGSNEGYIL